MPPLRELPVPGQVVAVAAIGVVNPVGGKEGVVIVGIEDIGRTAFYADATQSLRPGFLRPGVKVVETGAGRFGQAVVTGPFHGNSGKARIERKLLYIFAKTQREHAGLRLFERYDRCRKDSREVGVASMGPAGDAAGSRHFRPFQADDDIRGAAPATHTVTGVDAHHTLSRAAEGVAVHTGTLRSGEFGRDAFLREGHFIVTGTGTFVFVFQQQGNHFAYTGRNQEVAQVRTACTGQVIVAETQDEMMAVMVAGGALVIRVRTQLDHAVGQRGSRVGIAGKIGPVEDVYIIGGLPHTRTGGESQRNSQYEGPIHRRAC